MEDKRCPVFVDGKECGLPLTQIDREGRFESGTYKCDLGHRSYWVSYFPPVFALGPIEHTSDNAVSVNVFEEEPPKPPPNEDEPKPPIKEPPIEEPPVKEPPPKNG